MTERLTKPRSPPSTGKMERLHQTLQQELLTVHEPFETIGQAQAAVDAWRREYNADRPHQSLAMAFPAAPFAPPPARCSGCACPPRSPRPRLTPRRPPPLPTLSRRWRRMSAARPGNG